MRSPSWLKVSLIPQSREKEVREEIEGAKKRIDSDISSATNKDKEICKREGERDSVVINLKHREGRERYHRRTTKPHHSKARTRRWGSRSGRWICT